MNKTEALLPFYMKEEQYQGMFEGIEVLLNMSIIPLAIEGLSQKTFSDVRNKANSFVSSIVKSKDPRNKLQAYNPQGFFLNVFTVPETSVFNLPALKQDTQQAGMYPLFSADRPLQDWCYKGVYLQSGFHLMTCVGAGYSQAIIANAMLGYDMMVNASNSLEPVDHDPSDIKIDHGLLEQSDSTYYSEGCGRWFRRLVILRNYWMVSIMAHLMDKDPVVEWDRFKKAGGWYFLQYKKLCP